MVLEALCPECEGPVALRDPMMGEIVPCAACGADLEVVALEPAAARPGAGRAGGLGRMTRVAVIASRIRVEEKLLLQALEAAGRRRDRW